MARNLRNLVVGAVALLVPLGSFRVAADDDAWGYGAGEVSVDMGVSGSVSLETFQSPLAAHGDWVVSAGYGRVWRPYVAAGWRPYYYGRWEWTDEGWFWVSDEPFGWAVYHYGRWAWDPGYGWIWVPGTQWAPAWVTWRYGGDAIGWAPLAPGLSIYVTSYPFYDFWWTFVPTVRFVGIPVYRVAYAPSYTRRWYGATSPAPPRARHPDPRASPAPAWGGPAPRFVQERTGRPVMPVRVVPAASPGVAPPRADAVPVYRPEGGGPGRPAPAYDRDRGRGPGVAPARGRGGWIEPAPPSRGA
ncbi:MAG TPA: DUF6600 domain-containing protein, partial [Anaeromyxobacteraceae bacterium]|nr:DUF6600 domain-containing protein [Anaeromyxobacteraceae bacterium]